MKFLIWTGTGLVALLWTLAIAVMASLANWLAGSTDQAVGGLQAIGHEGSCGGEHTAPRNACGKGHQEPFGGKSAQRLVGAQEAP